ncbi:unnamed protein product [Notodromas monacha]|uniref:Serine/arginine repetitive matrix protein 1 n=1 Tax=Notodromas monacha TaxID=399045 RepID=A0A7R9GDW7_9CRUS|nr:unnamed protein product [Notodromas monacha]CAG0917402.1 unnamed protein product [Notodromas monacha]
MTDAGFFRGTSSDQDNRFSDKEKKLLKQMKFAEVLSKKVDMSKVKLDVVKPWITSRITELLGSEDEVVVSYIFNQLEEKLPDPRLMQINVTGFLNGRNARLFMEELWTHLVNAAESPTGIPEAFMEMKRQELKKRNEEAERVREAVKNAEREMVRRESRFNAQEESAPKKSWADSENSRTERPSREDRRPRSRSSSPGYRSRKSNENPRNR